ncbi:MAG: hypothetical protein WCG19_06005 [Chlorobiaceae bacterium]
MPEENAAVHQPQAMTQPGITELVKFAPLAIPLALPLLLHAIHGIAVGGIGVAAVTLALGPKGRELITSSGEVLCNLLPVAEKGESVKKIQAEVSPTLQA